MKSSLLIALCLFIIAAITPDSAAASRAQAIEKYKRTCAMAAIRTERRQGIPQHLLTAIGLAESGRWVSGSGEKFAWPWTVTSGSNGRFFPSKAAAIKEVKKMQAEGITNIDVGCMQVNLHYHGDAFASLEQAFNPARNTAYGATFLKKLFKEERSWIRATGRYHSSTPDKAKGYRTKVNGFWKEARRNRHKSKGKSKSKDRMQDILLASLETEPLAQAPLTISYYEESPLKPNQSTQLNENFRSRVNDPADDKNVGNLQVADNGWNSRALDMGRRMGADTMGVEALKKRLRAEASRAQSRGTGLERTARAYSNKQYRRGQSARQNFAQRRSQQLQVWQKRRRR